MGAHTTSSPALALARLAAAGDGKIMRGCRCSPAVQTDRLATTLLRLELRSIVLARTRRPDRTLTSLQREGPRVAAVAGVRDDGSWMR